MNEEAKLINIESDYEKALAEREAVEAELKKLTEKETQKAHRIELLRNRYKEEKRRSRTHRLIERGAILESILPDAESYSNDQIKQILRVAFSSLPVNLKGAFSMMILMNNSEKADCEVSILLPLIIPRAHLYTTDMVCALCEA